MQLLHAVINVSYGVVYERGLVNEGEALRGQRSVMSSFHRQNNNIISTVITAGIQYTREERERGRETIRQRDRDRKIETERQTEKETERERQRQRDRDRERERREREERGRDSLMFPFMYDNHRSPLMENENLTKCVSE